MRIDFFHNCSFEVNQSHLLISECIFTRLPTYSSNNALTVLLLSLHNIISIHAIPASISYLILTSISIIQLLSFFSKLKELSKRTTFIRVTQQINEVFGSTNEEKEEVSMPIELTGNLSQAQVADVNTDGGDSKRARSNK